MKRRILSAALALLIIISVAMTGTYAAGLVNPIYQNVRKIANNLELVNTVSWDAAQGREESFALRLTGPGDVYPIVMKPDTIYGVMNISGAVAYAESQGKNVLAAINSDFFSLQSGVPLGIVIEDGIYKSSAENEPAVVFGADGSVGFTPNTQVSISLSNLGGQSMENAGKSVSLNHFNKARAESGGMYLYSSAFSTVSTRTTTPGWFVRFKILNGVPTVSGEMTLEVTEKFYSEMAIPIGDEYLILSAASANGLDSEFSKFAVGDIVTMTTTCGDPVLAAASFATGAGDKLISNGALTDPETWDKAIANTAPRTAFGVKADGTVVALVVDGRKSDHSVGLKLSELADELLALGCVNAVNFDGGGSSAMSVRLTGEAGATVKNVISDGVERKCSTYILFVTDAVPNGAARNLGLKNDGVIVLTGSKTDIIPAASDSGYKPAVLPEDVTAVSSGLGAVEGLTYTAGKSGGTDVITLSSASTGAAGSGSVFVISEPTSIRATLDGGKTPITTLRIYAGDKVQISPIATFYRRDVIADYSSFTYEVAGGIGEITADGVLTASLTSPAKGTIKISAGETYAEINVEVFGFADMVSHWAKDFVIDLAEKGVVQGTTDSTFEPDSYIKRGDFVLMLYRAVGKPTVETLDAFTDVLPEDYYAEAIAWAKEAGIAQGVGDGRFDPKSQLTRQQAFTFVYRALPLLNTLYKEGAFSDGGEKDLSLFTDTDSIEEYAYIPTATLVKLGIVGGSEGKLMPNLSLKRAEMAKVLSVVLNADTIDVPPEEEETGGADTETPEEETQDTENPDGEVPAEENTEPKNPEAAG